MPFYTSTSGSGSYFYGNEKYIGRFYFQDELEKKDYTEEDFFKIVEKGINRFFAGNRIKLICKRSFLTLFDCQEAIFECGANCPFSFKSLKEIIKCMHIPANAKPAEAGIIENRKKDIITRLILGAISSEKYYSSNTDSDYDYGIYKKAEEFFVNMSEEERMNRFFEYFKNEFYGEKK